jgi:hypothetical protein
MKILVIAGAVLVALLAAWLLLRPESMVKRPLFEERSKAATTRSTPG